MSKDRIAYVPSYGFGDEPSPREAEMMDFVSDCNIVQALNGCLRSFRGHGDAVNDFLIHMSDADWSYLRLQVVRNNNFGPAVLNGIFMSFVGSKVSEIKSQNHGMQDLRPIKRRLRAMTTNTRKRIRGLTYS